MKEERKRLSLLLFLVPVMLALLAFVVARSYFRLQNGSLPTVAQILNDIFSLRPGKPKIPQDASAARLYLISQEYKDKGWIEDAREASQKAIEKGSGDRSAKAAAQFVRFALPKFPVSQDAQDRNVDGFNALASGDYNAAEKIFRALIKDYPNFEWPLGNLASSYIERGKFADAEPLVEQALKINPDYLNGRYYKVLILSRSKSPKLRLEALSLARQTLKELDTEIDGGTQISDVCGNLQALLSREQSGSL